MQVNSTLRSDAISAMRRAADAAENQNHAGEKFAIAAYFAQGLLKQAYCVLPHLRKMVSDGYLPADVLSDFEGAVAAAEGRDVSPDRSVLLREAS